MAYQTITCLCLQKDGKESEETSMHDDTTDDDFTHEENDFPEKEVCNVTTLAS